MILTDYSVKLRITVFVLTAILLVAGPLMYLGLPREGAPDITIPYVFVTAPYEGVAPAEIENLITIPMEKRFNGLENIEEMRSTASEGVSVTVIKFLPRQNIDLAIQKVKDKIDLARPDLPQDLDEPTVQGLNFSTDIPVLKMAVSGDTDLARLKEIAEDLQDAVERIPGVLEAKLYGAREREIRVDVDVQRLTAYALTLGDVSAAIQKENSTVSAGNLNLPGGKFQLRIPGEFTDAMAMRDIVVKTENGHPLHLTDVAEVSDTYKDVTSISRVNGRPCVALAIHKRAGENTDALIRQVKKTVAGGALPPGIEATIVDDQSEIIRMMIEDLENNIASGFILVVAVLLLFMGWRNSMLVAMAIPFSLMIGFIVLGLMGLTLNMIVLFSLVLAVGMLVDNAIVIVENIYRLHCDGLSRVDAALKGASEVAWPVINSTLTTVAAFLPLCFWPGLMGQFMSFLPKTVIIVLLASLFVAMVMNPAICSVIIGGGRSGEPGEAGMRWGRVMRSYERLLRGALNHRGLCLLLGFVFMFFTVAAFGRFGKGVELFPDTEPRRASIEVRYPEGTDIATTDATLRKIEEGLRPYGDIKFYLTNVGTAGQWVMSSGAGEHLGSIQIEFVEFAKRKHSTLRLVDEIRAGIGQFPGAVVTVDREKEGPPTGAPVSIEASGEDFDVLQTVADEIAAEIKSVPGLVDVAQDMEKAMPELQFRVDRQRAAMLNLDTAAVGQYLRTAVNGMEVSKFRAGEDEYDITVRLREGQRRSVDLLKQVSMTTKDGDRVPLASLGAFAYEGGRGQILRKDQKRVITITGNSQGRGSDKVLADVRARVSSMRLPKGYEVSYTGENKDMMEAFVFLRKAFLIALALIALILVMEFNSVFQPLMVMISVILSMIGVMWALMLCGMRFGVIMTGIGVISLAGVVVNNGIVLIDYINQRKAGGLATTDAIVTAGALRLRPVLLTAITTVVGLIPMAIGWSVEFHAFPPHIVRSAETSAWWAPMAVAVIFGLTLATVLTLLQVPVMYSLADSFVRRLRGRAQRVKSGSDLDRIFSPSVPH